MAGALFVVVTGGIFATGVLFHTGHPVAAVAVGTAAYFAVWWLWRFWTD